MQKISVFIILIFCFVFLNNVSAGVQSRQFEVMTGYGIGHLSVEAEDCAIIPLIARVSWELKPGRYLGGDLFYSFMLEPAPEMETGCGIFWQQRYRNHESISPYWEVEGGLIYTSLKTEDQATQGNFIFQTGLGTYISLKDDLKLDIGYRFRHYSNGAIELPNIGVNHHMLLVGLCWEF